jgi:glucose-6-phosphate isomerase
VPVEFIGVLDEDTPLPLASTHHRLVNLNMRAQAEAMARGRSPAETRAALSQGSQEQEDAAMTAHRSFEGNVPTQLLWLDRLNPRHLGALIALYEHKVFVQAAIWRINAFDQWGVELGKSMAKALEGQN